MNIKNLLVENLTCKSSFKTFNEQGYRNRVVNKISRKTLQELYEPELNSRKWKWLDLACLISVIRCQKSNTFPSG